MRILSITGGGVWGAGVAYFNRLVSKKIAEPSEYFEGFAGTSTGAIIAACYAHGLGAYEVDDLYRKKVGKIFTKNNWFKRLAPAVPRYTNREFKKILKEVFGDTRMCDLRDCAKSCEGLTHNLKVAILARKGPTGRGTSAMRIGASTTSWQATRGAPPATSVYAAGEHG